MKSKFILCLSKHCVMKTHVGGEVYIQALLTSTLDEGYRLASRPGCFTSDTH